MSMFPFLISMKGNISQNKKNDYNLFFSQYLQMEMSWYQTNWLYTGTYLDLVEAPHMTGVQNNLWLSRSLSTSYCTCQSQHTATCVEYLDFNTYTQQHTIAVSLYRTFKFPQPTSNFSYPCQLAYADDTERAMKSLYRSLIFYKFKEARKVNKILYKHCTPVHSQGTFQAPVIFVIV